LVTVRDKGDLTMPVILRAELADGQAQTFTFPAERTWFGGSRQFVARIPLRGKTLKSVTLDPDNRFQDLDRTSNSWPR
jgi:hypothetical protein